MRIFEATVFITEKEIDDCDSINKVYDLIAIRAQLAQMKIKDEISENRIIF